VQPIEMKGLELFNVEFMFKVQTDCLLYNAALLIC